jgi:hypothetical protein
MGDVSLLEESCWEDAGRKSPPAASGAASGGTSPQQMDVPTPSYWETAEDWQQRLMPHWQKRGAVVAEEEEFVALMEQLELAPEHAEASRPAPLHRHASDRSGPQPDAPSPRSPRTVQASFRSAGGPASPARSGSGQSVDGHLPVQEDRTDYTTDNNDGDSIFLDRSRPKVPPAEREELSLDTVRLRFGMPTKLEARAHGHTKAAGGAFGAAGRQPQVRRGRSGHSGATLYTVYGESLMK